MQRNRSARENTRQSGRVLRFADSGNLDPYISPGDDVVVRGPRPERGHKRLQAGIKKVLVGIPVRELTRGGVEASERTDVVVDQAAVNREIALVWHAAAAHAAPAAQGCLERAVGAICVHFSLVAGENSRLNDKIARSLVWVDLHIV